MVTPDVRSSRFHQMLFGWGTTLAQRVARWREQLRHAFALPGSAEAPPPEQLAAAERFCALVVERRWEVPVLAALEMAAPLHNVTAQALTFVQPLTDALFAGDTLRHWSEFLERSDATSRLMERIAQLVQARTMTPS